MGDYRVSTPVDVILAELGLMALPNVWLLRAQDYKIVLENHLLFGCLKLQESQDECLYKVYAPGAGPPHYGQASDQLSVVGIAGVCLSQIAAAVL